MKVMLCVNMHGLCNEAIGFYMSVFDIADVTITTFRDAIELSTLEVPDECKDMVYSADLSIPVENGVFTLRMGDSPTHIFSKTEQKKGNIDNVTIEISSDNADEIEKMYSRLISGGGKTNIPLGKTKYASLYGSLIDKYGICWIVKCRI